MNEYRIVWHQRPHNAHTARILYVDARTPADAEALARDHVERRYGIEGFTIVSVHEAPTVPEGRVKE